MAGQDLQGAKQKSAGIGLNVNISKIIYMLIYAANKKRNLYNLCIDSI